MANTPAQLLGACSLHCKSKARSLAKCEVPVHVMEDNPQVLLGKSHYFMLGGINNPELAANSMETNWYSVTSSPVAIGTGPKQIKITYNFSSPKFSHIAFP